MSEMSVLFTKERVR